MMHQVIVRAEDVANAINKIVDGDIYQLIPFRRRDIDLFLILWEEHYHTTSVAVACGQQEEAICV